MKLKVRNMIYKSAAAAGCAMMLFASAACADNGAAEKQVKVVEDVVDEVGNSSAVELEAEKITKLDDVIGLGWLSEDRIIKETIEITPRGEGEEPEIKESFAVHNVSTGEDTPWEAGNGVIWVSPDGKQAFVAVLKGDKYKLSGRMVSTENGEFAEVALENGIMAGGWKDSELFVFADQGGQMLQVDKQGNVTKLPIENSESGVLGIAQRGDTVYFLTGEGELNAYSVADRQVKRIAEKIVEFEVSPDGQRIAIATNRSESERTLEILGAEGESLGVPAANGTLIERIAWSPDGTKLAFSVYSIVDGGMNGVYVLDTETNHVVPVSDFQNIQYPLRWSPSGKQLMATVGSEDPDGPKQTTYLITFS